MATPSCHDWTLEKLKICRILRERGNQFFQDKRWLDAITEYDRSLIVLPPISCAGFRHLRPIRESLVFALTNRAATHIKLKNWDQCIRDCTRVLDWDPLCSKALFRRATALYHLNCHHDYISRSRDDLMRVVAMSARKNKVSAPVQKLLARVNSHYESIRDTTTNEESQLPRRCRLNDIAENALFVVAGFLRPGELGDCMCTSKMMHPACSSPLVWRCLYRMRWGDLCCRSHTVHAEQLVEHDDWQTLCRKMLLGIDKLQLQVINRETNRNLEFTMSAYDAQATYRLELDAWHVTYLDDGRGLMCETLPTKQLRPLPNDLPAPIPFTLHQRSMKRMSASCNEFHVGDGVEIQWKRHPHHPFGWWYGVVSEIFQDTIATTGAVGDIVHLQIPGAPICVVVPSSETEEANATKTATATAEEASEKTILTKITVVFDQYFKESPWHSVTVVLNTTEAVRSLGGWVGGIRLSKTSKKCWTKFLPDKKIL